MAMDAAQKKMIQPTDQQDSDLHNNLGNQLGKMGHVTSTQPQTQQPLPLTEDLKAIGTDATDLAGSTFAELMEGEGRESRDRVAHKNPLGILKGKLWKSHKPAA